MIKTYMKLASTEFAKTGQDEITLEHEGYTVKIEKNRILAGESLVEKTSYNISAHGAGQPCGTCGGTGKA